MEFETITTGLELPEGPVILADGSVIVVEMRGKRLTRVTPDGVRETLAELGGGPNGAAIGPDGAVYICNNGGNEFVDLPGGGFSIVGPAPGYVSGSIQRYDFATREVTTLYTSCDGKKLKAPNDLVFDETGGFWFTDTGKLTAEYTEHGALFYARPDGSSIVKVRDELITPNGVGLSPDGRTLYVSESFTTRLWVYDLAGPGQIADGEGGRFAKYRVFGPMPGYEVVDSLAVDSAGNICVASIVTGGIAVFSPSGEMEFVSAPDPVITNLCFGGPDMRDVWVTGGLTGKLFKGRWPRPGLRLVYNA